MKMGKEFYELVEVGRKARTRSLKLMVAGDIESLMAEYPYNGYKYKVAQKAVKQLREEASR